MIEDTCPVCLQLSICRQTPLIVIDRITTKLQANLENEDISYTSDGFNQQDASELEDQEARFDTEVEIHNLK